MSYDIELNPKQKLWCATSALEQIKDAPISIEEAADIARDALHLIHIGSAGLGPLNTYARVLLENMPRGPRP